MLPRPVAVFIAIVLTVAELLNVIGQVFLGAGDSAFHIAYPAVLGALGVVAKKPESHTADPPSPVESAADAVASTVSSIAARHRREGR